jgi:hypothetical protein
MESGAHLQGFNGPHRWFRSADGNSWQEISAFGPLGPKSYSVSFADIQSDGERLMARVADGRMWTSFDGLSWTELGGTAPSEGQADELMLLPRGVLYSGFGDRYGLAYGEAE